MDPILEEMRRVKAVSDIRESRYRFWVDYLSHRISALEAELSKHEELASLAHRPKGKAVQA